MSDISNQTLGMLVGIALMVSLFGLFSIPNNLISIGGFGTIGQARINISSSAALNVTQDMIDFGNGTVESSFTSCTLSSEEFILTGNADPINCWTGSGAQTGGFNVVNIGNTYLNVTATATKRNLSDGTNSFWGVTGAQYMWRCIGNGTIASPIYRAIENDTATNCTSTLSPTNGQDAFTMHINITFPSNVTGTHNDTITFTGSLA